MSSSSHNNVWGLEDEYASFPKRKEEVRQSLLKNPRRFQAISEREDRSDMPAEADLAFTMGRYFILHRGCIVMKSPTDMIVLKELFAQVKPATVIELGTFTGGSAVWMADMLRLEEVKCSIYTMDIDPTIREERVKEINPENIYFLQGDSFKIAETFTSDLLKTFPHPWVVIDDAHANVPGVLEHFAGHMKTGDYFVVEDTNPNVPEKLELGGGRIVVSDLKPIGKVKLDQLRAFFTKHEKEFAVDSYFTDFFGYNGTWNWNGYIRRM